MSIGINELFEMLNWNNDEDIQKKGIEEGMKIKYISILIQPIEDKSIWENFGIRCKSIGFVKL